MEIKLIAPLLPVIILLLGGQQLMNKYAIMKKKQESEIELIATIRNQQYETLKELYSLFAKFMELYRRINSPLTDLSESSTVKELFQEASKAESQIDAIILKIGGEFTKEKDNQKEIEKMLGELRQSVQIWRESIVNRNKLPFGISTQEDYMRFKVAFSHVSAFMVNRIHQSLEPHKAKMQRVESTLVDAFHHKHENWKAGHYYIGTLD